MHLQNECKYFTVIYIGILNGQSLFATEINYINHVKMLIQFSKVALKNGCYEMFRCSNVTTVYFGKIQVTGT